MEFLRYDIICIHEWMPRRKEPRDRGVGYAPKIVSPHTRGAIGYTIGATRRPVGSFYRDFFNSPHHPFVERILQKDCVMKKTLGKI